VPESSLDNAIDDIEGISTVDEPSALADGRQI